VFVFTQRLLARHHATRHTFCRRIHVYHLASHVLYDGVDNVRPRDRRRRSALAIKARLMSLDLGISRRDLHVLASEEERLKYCDRLGIERARLPQRVWRPYRSAGVQRVFFPDPIVFAIADPQDAAPTLVCIHIDEGGRGVAGFETFLRRHARFLAAVPRWQVIYVGQRRQQLPAATKAFARAFGTDPGLARARDVAEIGEYFHLRQLYEQQRWGELQTEGLNRYLDLRARIGRDLDPLFARWEIEGDHALNHARSLLGSAGRDPRFEAVLLPYSYLATERIEACSLGSRPGDTLS
jgi:hypothetical protein